VHRRPKILPGSGSRVADIFRWLATRHPRRQFGMWRIMSHLARVMPAWRLQSFSGPDGEPFVLDVADRGSGYYAIGGWSVDDVTAVIGDLPPDAIALDIGANVGVWSRMLARHCPRGHVFAFEPSLPTYEVPARNVSRLQNVTCIRSAVGAASGSVAYSNVGVPGALRRIQQGVVQSGCSVPCVRLLDWVAGQGLNRVDFIKVDVEGFEADVLVPAVDRLRALNTRILFEFIPSLVPQTTDRGQAPDHLFERLMRAGYHIHRVDQLGNYLSDEVRADLLSNNYLAVPSPNPK
jgi:FkbM family methyltransferase